MKILTLKVWEFNIANFIVGKKWVQVSIFRWVRVIISKILTKNVRFSAWKWDAGVQVKNGYQEFRKKHNVTAIFDPVKIKTLSIVVRDKVSRGAKFFIAYLPDFLSLVVPKIYAKNPILPLFLKWLTIGMGFTTFWCSAILSAMKFSVKAFTQLPISCEHLGRPNSTTFWPTSFHCLAISSARKLSVRMPMPMSKTFLSFIVLETFVKKEIIDHPSLFSEWNPLPIDRCSPKALWIICGQCCIFFCFFYLNRVFELEHRQQMGITFFQL